jgi:hypothetical protein
MVGMITAEKCIISGEKEAESVADYGFPCLMDSKCGIHSGGDSFYPCASIPWLVTATGAGAYSIRPIRRIGTIQTGTFLASAAEFAWLSPFIRMKFRSRNSEARFASFSVPAS